MTVTVTATRRRGRLAAALVLAVVSTLGAGVGTASALLPVKGGSEPAALEPARDAVLFWNAAAGRAATAACIAPLDNPLHESRMYAMTHLAVHDALNAIERRYDAYASRPQVTGPASAEAAVVAAARDVLTATVREIPAPFPQECRDAGVSSVERDYAQAVTALPPSAEVTEGLTVGRAAAAAVLAKRAGDGSDTPLVVSDFPQGTTPGAWRFTPDRPFAFRPGVGRGAPLRAALADPVRQPTALPPVEWEVCR